MTQETDLNVLRQAPYEYEPLPSIRGVSFEKLRWAGLIKIEVLAPPLPAYVVQRWKITKAGRCLLGR
jgi:hypothetical protein